MATARTETQKKITETKKRIVALGGTPCKRGYGDDKDLLTVETEQIPLFYDIDNEDLSTIKSCKLIDWWLTKTERTIASLEAAKLKLQAAKEIIEDMPVSALITIDEVHRFSNNNEDRNEIRIFFEDLESDEEYLNSLEAQEQEQFREAERLKAKRKRDENKEGRIKKVKEQKWKYIR
jgi:hypothetical protein